MHHPVCVQGHLSGQVWLTNSSAEIQPMNFSSSSPLLLQSVVNYFKLLNLNFPWFSLALRIPSALQLQALVNVEKRKRKARNFFPESLWKLKNPIPALVISLFIIRSRFLTLQLCDQNYNCFVTKKVYKRSVAIMTTFITAISPEFAQVSAQAFEAKLQIFLFCPIGSIHKHTLRMNWKLFRQNLILNHPASYHHSWLTSQS